VGSKNLFLFVVDLQKFMGHNFLGHNNLNLFTCCCPGIGGIIHHKMQSCLNDVHLVELSTKEENAYLLINKIVHLGREVHNHAFCSSLVFLALFI
jgi:hypothetical protein